MCQLKGFDMTNTLIILCECNKLEYSIITVFWLLSIREIMNGNLELLQTDSKLYCMEKRRV